MIGQCNIFFSSSLFRQFHLQSLTSNFFLIAANDTSSIHCEIPKCLKFPPKTLHFAAPSMSQRPKTGFPPARPLYALNFPKQDCVNTSKNGDCILCGAEKSPPGTDHFRQTLAWQTKFHSTMHPTTHSVENYYFLQLPKSYLFLNNTFFCKWENSLATSDTFEV